MLNTIQGARAGKRTVGMSDLNVDIVVSIQGHAIPEQIVAPMTKDKKLNDARGINFFPKPVTQVAGHRLQLRIEAVEVDGLRRDITNSKFVTVFATREIAHVCDKTQLCLWPKGQNPDARSDPPTARYGRAHIEAEYMTPDGKIGFNGFDINVLPKHPSDLLPLPDEDIKKPSAPPKGQELLPAAWKDLQSLHGIEVKARATDITQLIVFFDPNCPFSAELWQRLYGDQSKHKDIASFWIPVAYMNASSQGKVASLLEQGSAQALAANFAAFDKAARQGRAEAIPVSPKMRQEIKRNNAYWSKLFGGTPLMIARLGQKTYLYTGLLEQDRFEALLNQLPPSTLGSYVK